MDTLHILVLVWSLLHFLCCVPALDRGRPLLTVVLSLVGNAANVGFLVWMDSLALAALWVVVQMVTLHFIIHTRTRRVAAE